MEVKRPNVDIFVINKKRIAEFLFILPFEARLLTETLSSIEKITAITASGFVAKVSKTDVRAQIRNKWKMGQKK